MKKNKVMTPKEKAEELVLKMLRINNNTQEWFHKGLAKQCALIAVDEVLNNENGKLDYESDIKYWQDVKREIKKL